MDWTEDVIARLRQLWDEGHSTAEIGRRLGVTKNAVVGKAHRLSLPPRPSPIRRGPAQAAAQPRRVTGPTLPQLGTPAEHAPAPERVPSPEHAAERTPERVAAPEPVRAVRPALRPVLAPRAGRVSACCWPIGEPGTRAFHFCDDPAMTGRPYCETHALLAYVKVRDRREDAA